MIYAACNGYAYMLNPSTGEVLATNSFDGYGNHEMHMAMAGTTLVIGLDGHAFGLDPNNFGTAAWTNDLDNSGQHITYVAGTVLNGSPVAYAGCDGYLYSIDASLSGSGSTLGYNSMDGVGMAQTRLAVDESAGLLYIGVNGFALGCPLGDISNPWRTPLPNSSSDITNVVGQSGYAYFGNNGYVWQLDGAGGTVVGTSNMPGTGHFETRVTVDKDVQLYAGINFMVAGIALQNYKTTFQTWMGDMQSTIGPKKLRHVCLPGTHDSGTYSVTSSSSLSSDAPSTVATAYSDGVYTETIAGYSKAQQSNFLVQLQNGIRYLDLRTEFKGNGNFVFCHSLEGAPLSELLSQLSAFYSDQANAKEVVILDFNHFYGSVDGAAFDHATFVATLRQSLGPLLTPASFGNNVVLNDLWASPHRVIALYADDATAQSNADIVWPDSSIVSNWPNTTSVDTLKSTLYDEVPTIAQATTFFVLQGILTPDTNSIVAGILSGILTGSDQSLLSMASDVRPLLCTWIEQDWASQGFNIVITDWFDLTPEFVGAVINANKTGPLS